MVIEEGNDSKALPKSSVFTAGSLAEGENRVAISRMLEQFDTSDPGEGKFLTSPVQ
jgi:hypothetical protein